MTATRGTLRKSLSRTRSCRLWSLLAAAWLLCASPVFAEESIPAALIVPEASGVAKKIYDDVVEGILADKRLDIDIITINKETTASDLQPQLEQLDVDMALAIGNTSYKLCEQVKLDGTKIAGGISGAPNGIPTVSLTAHPRETFAELKRIAPEIKQVRLVYNDSINGWWYRLAMAIAPEFNLVVHGYEAEDIKQGVKLFERMLSGATPKETAIWIPLRGIVPSKTILPLVLEKAWSKKLAVISNNPSHTKLGGLLALYPNHSGMGRQIANFAVSQHRGQDKAVITGTHSVRTAINVRTSAHIGIRISSDDEQTFDRIYPVQR